MKKFKIGLIGHTGRGNYGHSLDAAFDKNPEAEVKALVDFNFDEGIKKSKQMGVNFYSNPADMYKNEMLDIVIVAPRFTDSHYDLVKEALLNDCHVLCEKPFVNSLDQGDELIKLAENKKLKIAVALPFVYEDRFKQLVDLLNNKKIGNVYKVEGVCKQDHRGGGEDFAILGPHFADMMINLFGNPISGYGYISKENMPLKVEDFYLGNEGLGHIAGDNIEATYKFKNGVIGSIRSKKLEITERKEQPYYLMIHGSKGILYIRAPYADHSIWYYPRPFVDPQKQLNWEKIYTTKVNTYGDYQKLIGSNLIDAIKCDSNPKSSADSFNKVLEMLIMPYYSQLLNSSIDFPIKNRNEIVKSLRGVKTAN